ncbi:MAG: PAS domain S-box protein [Sulfurospirillum sp.]
MTLDQYKNAIEQSNIVSKTDINGIITFVNDEFCKIFEYTREELIGKNHNIVRHPDVPKEIFKSLWDTILAKKTYKAMVKNLSKYGKTLYVNTTVIPILDKRGEIEEFIAIRYDMTESVELARQMQEKDRFLFQQSRLAAMGEMIGNIAHQWRQPLNELGITVYQMKKFFLSDKREKEFLQSYDHSKDVIKKMSSTIEDFRNFFNPNKQKEIFLLRDAIDELLRMMQGSIQRHSLHIEAENKKKIYIYGFFNEFNQVMLNLINNSKDAFNQRKIKKREIKIAVDIDEKQNAVIIYSDNAKGIDENIIDKIFDPYFTTKHSSEGTGLGLYMSEMIIQKSMSGSIKAYNNKNGATFEIKIPALKETVK